MLNNVFLIQRSVFLIQRSVFLIQHFLQRPHDIMER